MSKRALLEQNVPTKVIEQYKEPASVITQFETGGALQVADESLLMTSPIIGKTEAFIMKQARLMREETDPVKKDKTACKGKTKNDGGGDG